MVRIVGNVHIDKMELAARCSKCRKTLAYRQAMRLEMWRELLKSFIKRHNLECR